MFWKKGTLGINLEKKEIQNEVPAPVTIDALRQILANMVDVDIIERQTGIEQKVTLVYITTLINQERLNESIIEKLNRCSHDTVYECIANANVTKIVTLHEAQERLLQGSILLYEAEHNVWWAVQLENPLSRAVESSATETVIYGARDSFTEQIEKNITMIRRRLPVAALKTEKFTVGSLSKSTVVLMYIEGVTNPELISIARSKISAVEFDQFLDSSQLGAFMEDHLNSVFPQFQETDRPDACAFSLGVGKVVILIDNTPYALIAPITFFHLFQSPEDYFLRWIISSFLRCIRYVSFFLSVTLIPFYVALTTHHYQMLPLQMLSVLLESRGKLPFTPFWEAFLMLITLEIIKEASLRMPTKSGQTLGVIGGIVIGQATVAAGFASKVLIVLAGISAIASFLVPNYEMTKSNTMIQFILLVLSAGLGIFGIALGGIAVLTHLNALTSLKQPYFAPVSPLYLKDWNDLFIRGPLRWMKTRPAYLQPLDKWRSSRRR